MPHEEQAQCRSCDWTGDYCLAEDACPVCGSDLIEPVSD